MQKKMNNLSKIIGTIFFVSIILSGCVTIKTSDLIRPIERFNSSWEVLGSVRVEILTGSNVTDLSIPYDQLLTKAREKYGEFADVIEIKQEVQILSLVEQSAIYKEQNKYYSKRFIYNAFVIKYLSSNNSGK